MVDRLTKSRFPTAVALGTGTASVPARDPMPPTTPRTGITDPCLAPWWILEQVAFWCADFKTEGRGTVAKQMMQELLPSGLMMPIELAISGDEMDLLVL